jgi:hypothetical protein
MRIRDRHNTPAVAFADSARGAMHERPYAVAVSSRLVAAETRTVVSPQDGTRSFGSASMKDGGLAFVAWALQSDKRDSL